MIDDQGWFDWMERRPGPPDKIYSARCTSELYIPHSAVGWYPGWASRLFSTARLPNGRYTSYAAASVTGWIELNGTCYQHYPIFASCWASGSAYPNTKGNAFENAGGAPGNEMQPLTPQQTQSNIRIALDIQDYHFRKNDGLWVHPERPKTPTDKGAQLYEHNECIRWVSLPTACPSQRLRYAWPKIVSALNNEENNMSDDRLDQVFLKLDGSGDPILFTVLDSGQPGGTKTIPLSRLDWLNYRALGFIVSDVKLGQNWVDTIQRAAHSEKHPHIITE